MTKNQYRDYFKKVQKYIKLTQVLERLDYPRTKFSSFLSGDDNVISIERLSNIKKEVIKTMKEMCK